MVGHKRVVQPQTPRRIQTNLFRVHIHCDGCKKKVRKLVQKIKGVESISIDAELGKLTVVGYVTPGTVIKKLAKSGKHAEMWGAYKSSHDLSRMNNQFKTMHLDFYDSSTEKPQNGNLGGHKQAQLARKDRKPVKFEFTDEDEDEFYKREGGDGLDDSDDSFELDFGRDSHKKPGKGSKETKATKGKMKEKKKKKKGGFFGIFGLGKKDKNKGDGKKKGRGGGGGARKSYSREEIYGGKAVSKSFGHVKDCSTGKDYATNGKNPPRYTGPSHRGKKSEPSFEIDLFDRGKGGGVPGRGRGGGVAPIGRLAGPPGHPGGYPSGPAQYEAQVGKIPPMHPAQMGNFPSIVPAQYQNHAKLGDPSMTQAGMNFPLTQAAGVPAMAASKGSEHYSPMGQGGGICNPQYMGMMGQQQAQWNGMVRPMMYGGPNPRPSYSHAPPMATPARYTDRYTLMFNDENTESCSIM